MPRNALSMIVFIAVVACIYPVSAFESQELQRRMDQLKRLSPIERDRFDRNVQDFQSLTAEQKSQFRELHNKIEDDRRTGKGSLSTLLKKYDGWLQTLSPLQQSELQRETDPARKLVLVQKIKKEQEQELENNEDRAPDSDGKNGPDRSAPPQFEMARLKFARMPLGLERDDLNSVMKFLVRELPPEKILPAFDPPLWDQYGNILSRHLEGTQNASEWPEAELRAKIKGQLRERPLFAIDNSAHWNESERNILVRLILMGIVRQANASVPKVTEADREKIKSTLSVDELEKLKSAPMERRRGVLTRKFLELKGLDPQMVKSAQDNRAKVIDQVRDLFAQFKVPVPEEFDQITKMGRPPGRK